MAITGEIDAVIGLGRRYATRLKPREAGLTAQGFEAATDVGGTWYWKPAIPARALRRAQPFYSYTFDDGLLGEMALRTEKLRRPAGDPALRPITWPTASSCGP